MLFYSCCLIVSMLMNVECLYVQEGLVAQDLWPINAQLNNQREDYAPAQLVLQPLDTLSASAIPREQTVIVVPNSGQTAIRSSPYNYGTNTMTRVPTVVVSMPNDPYVRY